MLGIAASVAGGVQAMRSIVKTGLQLWYKADKTQAPLGEEQIVNGNFEVGPDLFTNGDFTALRTELIADGDFALTGTLAANTTGTHWSTSSQWTIANNKATFLAVINNRLNVINAPFSAGDTVTLTFTISNSATGSPRVFIGNFDGNSDYIGGSYNLYPDGEHTVSFTVPSGQTTLSFYGLAGSGAFEISNISVKDQIQGYKTQIPSGQIVEVVDDKLHIKYDTSETQASTGVFQSVLVSGKSYTTTIDVASVTGTFKVQAGNVSHVINSTGIKTFTNVAANENLFIVRVSNSTDFEATINSISVKQNNPNDSWDLGTGWSVGDGSASCSGSQSGNTNLKQLVAINDIGQGRRYTLTYTISGYSGSGTINPHLKGTATGNVSGNGTKTVIGLAGSSTSYSIAFLAGSTFVGTVSDVTLREITNSIQDKSSNNNDGILKSGIALDFDGDATNPDYIELDYLPAGTAISASSKYTIACWFNAATTGNKMIFSSGQDGDNRLYLWTSTGILFFNFGDASGSVSTAPVVEANRWYRFVVAIDGLTATVYLDGEKKYTREPSSAFNLENNINIGRHGDEAKHEYDGMVSDFQIYSKAWTISDVEFDYNNPDFDVFDDAGRPEVLGADLADGYDFTSGWTPSGGVTVNDADTFTSATGDGGVYKNYLSVGSTYVMNIVGTTSANLLQVRNSGDGSLYFQSASTGDFSSTFTFTATRSDIFIKNTSAGEATITTLTVKEITQHKAEIQPTDCELLLRMNEGAGLKLYDAAPVLGAEEVINGDFSAPRVEEVTNGDFANALTDWTSSGTVSETGGVVTLGPSSAALVFQESVFENGKKYTVTIDVTSISVAGQSGDKEIINNDGTVLHVISSIGVQQFTFTHAITNTNLLIRARNNSVYSFTNISVKEVIPSWTAGTGWSNANGTAIQSGGTGQLFQQGVITAGKTYSVTVTIDSIASGTNLLIVLGSSSTALVFSNVGTTTLTGTAAADERLYLLGSGSGFSATISNISVKEIKPSNAYSYVDGDGDTDLWVYQQPYIPQLAMSSYSSKMVFNNSVGEFINCASNSSIDNIFDGGGTWSAWFSAESDGGGSVGTIISKSQVRIRTLADDNNDTTIQFLYTFDGDNGTWTCPTTAALLNKINHIAVTYDNSSVSNNPVMYINGVSQTVTRNTAPTGTRDTDAGSSFIIGNSVPTTTAQNFDGFIDEVSAFKIILTPTEITEIFNSGTVLNQRLHSKYNLDEKVTNGDFSQIGSELITDGDYPIGTSAWAGSSSNGWSISGGKASNDGNAGSNNLQQNSILTLNKLYQITLTVSNLVSGDVQVSAGGSPRNTITEDGTYTFTQTSSGTTFFIIARSFVGSVDNVSVKEVGQNWLKNSDTTLSVSNGQLDIQSANGVYGVAFSEVNFIAGKTYRLEFTVVSCNNQHQIRVGTDNTLAPGGPSASIYGSGDIGIGTHVKEFTASINHKYLSIGGRDDVTTLVIDNVSLKEVGLIAYWRNNGANTWHDLSVNSNDGAVNATYPELIANGTFTGDDGATPASWTASASNSTLTIDTNRIKVTLDSGVSFGNAHQSQVVKAGVTYEFKVDVISKSSGVAARIDRTATGADAITGGIGSVGNNQTVQFTATEDATYHIQLVVTGDGANAVFDNVSLKQVKPVTLKLQEVPFFKKDTFGFPMNNVREKGINLDGTSFVEVADGASINPTSAITIQCWIKSNTESNKGLVAKWNASAQDYMIFKDSSTFRLYIGTTHLASGTIPTTGWINIAGTYDGSNMKTFINGVQSSTSSLTGNIPNGSQALDIGRYNSDLTHFYSETIDDVQIYDTALSAAQLLKNYKATKSKHVDNSSIWSDDYADSLISSSGSSGGSSSSGSSGSGSGSSGGGGY